MSEDPRFVLDADVFIRAARDYYAFDLSTQFWEILLEHAGDGRVCSIDRVKKELDRGKDELAEWANNQFSDAFASTDRDEVVESYREIMQWVYAQTQFMDAAKADFADGADGWLVAYAIVDRRIVVTQEVLAPDVRRKVPIPNVCQAFGVRSVDVFAMLRMLRARPW
ncbi:MAG: DUF4411 family protein [Planctomycetota bacterium]